MAKIYKNSKNFVPQNWRARIAKCNFPFTSSELNISHLNMKKTLKRVAPLQFGKVAGAIYALLSLIFVPFFLIFAIIGSIASNDPSAPSPVIMIGLGLVGAVVVPIMYGILGFIGGVIGAWGYNLIAHWVGGIEIDVE